MSAVLLALAGSWVLQTSPSPSSADSRPLSQSVIPWIQIAVHVVPAPDEIGCRCHRRDFLVCVGLPGP
jgi:hypothetical protein